MHRRDAAYYTRFNGTSHDHEQLTLGCWQLTYQAVQAGTVGTYGTVFTRPIFLSGYSSN